jgi:type I restriction enzyme S subunit
MVNMGEIFAHTRIGNIEMDRVSLAEKEAAFLLQPGDLLFARQSLVLSGAGKCSLFLGAREPVTFESHLIRSRLRSDTADSAFYFYFFSSPKGRQTIESIVEQVAAAGIRGSDLARLEVPHPPLTEQKAVAQILGTLDDKIELNRRMNATLEAMARALFQSWFVDFDPVRAKLDGRQPAGLDPATAALFPAHFQDSEDGKLPIGWRLAPIGELCAINSWTLGKNDKLETLEYVEISEVNRGNIARIAIYMRGEEPSRARRRLRHGDTVLSTVRPDRGSHFLALNPPKNRVASTGFAVLTPTKAPWSFIHCALTQPEVSDHLGQMADGAAYPAVRPEIIGAWKVTVPDRAEILEAFHRTCSPLFEQAEANRIQSRTLATLRDTLLPKLLSGELSVASIP